MYIKNPTEVDFRYSVRSSDYHIPPGQTIGPVDDNHAKYMKANIAYLILTEQVTEGEAVKVEDPPKKEEETKEPEAPVVVSSLVGKVKGLGPTGVAKLEGAGITKLTQLYTMTKKELQNKLGTIAGSRVHNEIHGEVK